MDGQFTNIGDTETEFTIQSLSKIIGFVFLYDLIGDEIYHYIGKEPSGIDAMAPIFNYKGKPHNAFVNTGAIMVCSLIIKNGKNFKDILAFFQKATNTPKINVDFAKAHEKKNQNYKNVTL